MTSRPVAPSAGDYLHAIRAGKTIFIGGLGRAVVKPLPLFERSERSALCTGAGLVVESVMGGSDDSALGDASPPTLSARRR